MIKKYIKKPIPIEAVQWKGNNFNELEAFANDNVWLSDGFIYCKTLEGAFKAPNKVGDYLVKGIRGEFYICEKSIFEQTYQEVTDENN